MGSGVNTMKFIETNLKIVNKQGSLIPFTLNAPQIRLYETIKQQAMQGKPIRIIILKARQMGFSTLVEGIGFKRISTENNMRMAI